MNFQAGKITAITNISLEQFLDAPVKVHFFVNLDSLSAKGGVNLSDLSEERISE
jgi:hypothetical protein